MPPVQPNASVAAPSKSLRYIGKHCYAFSGTSTYSNETKEVLDFTVGSGYVIGRFFFQFDSTAFTAGERLGYRITLNEIEIVDSIGGDAPSMTYGSNYDLRIVLPPFTNVLVELICSDSSNINMGITFSGRVYGAE